MSGSPKRQGPPISFLPMSCNTEKRPKETAPLEKKKTKKPFASGSSRKGYLGYAIWGGFRGLKDQDRADQEELVWNHCAWRWGWWRWRLGVSVDLQSNSQ